jgi:hypothetical protein
MRFYLTNATLAYQSTVSLNHIIMQNEQINKRSRRCNDFPELQVGFPERNDVSNPNMEMERIHVDFETFGISKKSAAELIREIRGTNVPQA